MRLRHRRLTLASGVALELAEGGRAGARTALVLHGEDGPTSMAGTLEHLGVDHQVIAPTHPGWAGTARAPGLNGVGALARAYLDVLAEADAVDVVVVGASFGGWVGAQMAIDDDQGRIGALVLIGPIGVRVPGQAGAAPLAPRARGAGGARGPYQVLGGALGAYVGPLAHEPALIYRLSGVGVPALVVWGGGDEVVSPDYGRAWAGALGHAELVVVAGGGHLPSYRAPEVTFAAIDAFLCPPLVLTA